VLKAYREFRVLPKLVDKRLSLFVERPVHSLSGWKRVSGRKDDGERAAFREQAYEFQQIAERIRPEIERVDTEHFVPMLFCKGQRDDIRLEEREPTLVNRTAITPGSGAQHCGREIDAGDGSTGRTLQCKRKALAGAAAKFKHAVCWLYVQEIAAPVRFRCVLPNHSLANNATGDAGREAVLLVEESRPFRSHIHTGVVLHKNRVVTSYQQPVTPAVTMFSVLPGITDD
jgi:hypothetical protein